MSAAVLHRCTTPTNWLCPCGRIAREARKRGLELEEVRHPLRRSAAARDEVERLTGQRVLPVLVLDGEAVCDSLRIVEWLEWRDGGGAAGAVEGR